MATGPNVFDPVFDEEVTRYAEHGLRSRRARLGYQAGCERLGLSLWELEPGSEDVLHYHFGNEELLAVLSGRPMLTTAAGPRELASGEVAAFPRGPHGAHAVANPTDDPVRFLFFSEMRGPDVVIYPENGMLAAVERMSSPERGGMATWLRLTDPIEHHAPEEPDPARAPAAKRSVANLFEPELERVDDPPGYVARGAEIAKQAGARRLGASLYVLEPGNSICPYHWHAANEELVIVFAGKPTLRTPAGERELAEGEVVAFPIGEEGAHKVTNRSDGTVQVLMVSEMNEPEVAVYPDSGKVMARQQAPGTPATGVRAIFRFADAVDYWDGEA